MKKELYHFTSVHHLPSIIKSGYLKLTDSNLRINSWSIFNEEKKLMDEETIMKMLEPYKPVVWLTSSNDALGHGLEGSYVDKTEIKITVKFQNHFRLWKEWSRENEIDESWAVIMEEGYNADSWWISEKIIPLTKIYKIENKYTGEVYFENGIIINGVN